MSELSTFTPSKRLKFWLGPLLFLGAFLIYGSTIEHGYVWDDAIAITQNPRVQQGFAGIPGHFEFRARKEIADFNGYRPIALSSHSLDIELFGPQPEPAHLMQLLYFGLLCWVVYLFLGRLFPPLHSIYPFLAALLFLLHPIHVEVVANLKSRDELLALLLGLSSLIAFLSFHRKRNWLAGLAAAFLFVASMLCKENAVAFLGVMGLIVAMEPGKKPWVSWAWVGSTLGLLLFVFSLLTGHLPGASPPEVSTGFIENIVVSNAHAVEMGFVQRLMNSGYLLLLYLWNFFVPLKQVYFSGANAIPVLAGFSLRGLLGLLVFPTLLTLGIWWWRNLKRRPLAFGLFFFLGTLLIYLQLFFQVSDTMADRFMFAPSLGLCWLVAFGLFRFRPQILEKDPLNPVHVPHLIAVILLVLGLGAKTFSRSQAWKDNLTLFQTDMPRLETSARAHYYLAQELEKDFREGLDTSTGAEIVAHYRKSIALRSEMFYARTDLGNFLVYLDRFPEAIEVLEEAQQTFPGHPDPLYYLGKAQYLSGAFADAAPSFTRALNLSPGDLQSREMLARSYLKTGQLGRGIEVAQEGLSQAPNHIMMHDVLSDLYFDSGAIAASFTPLQEVLEIDPKNPFFWKKIIGRYQLQGDQESAARYYQMALDQGALSR